MIDKYKNSNDKKNKQLKMNYGTASHKLRKAIMFDLIKKLKLDTCFQCGKKIEHIKELSIEHKVPWLDSEDPVDLFFNLENITFSHLSCNISAARKYTKDRTSGVKEGGKKLRKNPPDGTNWCHKCKSFIKVKEFSKNRSKWSGLDDICKVCKKKSR